MYYIVFIILLIGSISEIRTGKTHPFFSKVMFLIMTAMAVFRYGQGSDYFNYESKLNDFEVMCSIDTVASVFLSTEPGYNIIQYLSVYFNLEYKYYIGGIALFMMLLFYTYLKRECKLSVCSLFAFYVLFYMTYELSAIRQGLVLALYYFWSYPLLVQRRITAHVFSILFLTTVHTSAIILLSIIFFEKISIDSRILKRCFFLAIVVLFLGQSLISKMPFIGYFADHLEEESTGNYLVAKLVRIIIIGLILKFPLSIFVGEKGLYKERTYFVYGFFIYTLCSFSELASSRVWAYFLGFEIILLGKLSLNSNRTKSKKQLLYIFLLILSVLWVKDVNGYIQQANYRNCNALSYPYISIFEGDNTLLYYRDKK